MLLQVAHLGTMAAAPNVRARAATLCSGNVPATLVQAGVPCKVRIPYTLACWAAAQQVLAQAGGKAPAAQVAQASTVDFVRYAMRRGWLVAVAA